MRVYSPVNSVPQNDIVTYGPTYSGMLHQGFIIAKKETPLFRKKIAFQMHWQDKEIALREKKTMWPIDK